MSDKIKEREKELIASLKKGESRAFDDLFNLHSIRVFRFAYSFLKNREDSEEIVQEVFLRVLEKRSRISDSFSFKAYLFSISHNIIIDRFRLHIRDQKYLEYLKANAKTADNVTDKSVEFASLDQLHREAVYQLPPRRKLIYNMNRNEGLSYTEIAKSLHISKNTVENQMSLALKFIRNKLGPESLLTVLFYYLFI